MTSTSPMKPVILEVQPEPVTGTSARTVLTLWWRRHRTRRELRQLVALDPARLHGDLGLTEHALDRECRKWFWQA